MGSFEGDMNKTFRTLVADIIPRDQIKEKAAEVVKLLQAESEFDIGSVCIAGSSGKKTTIMGSDIDCVLFINDKHPPFKDVLEDFHFILRTTNKFKIKEANRTRYSVQFKAFGFDFDILPAANLTVGLQEDGDKLIDLQQERVLHIIRRNPIINSYRYSCSLAFSSVRFMKQQDGFVNEMVRIAKYWYKTLRFYKLKKRAGAKNCIELIAVHAAIEEMENRSCLKAFKRFITYIQKFNSLNIDFGSNEHQNVRPRVMDPVNPYNNLASCWNKKQTITLNEYANETHKRLQDLEYSRIVNLDKLFMRQNIIFIKSRKSRKRSKKIKIKT